MKVELSPLKFKSFYVTEISYEFNLEAEDGELELDELPYDIDIDYLPGNSSDSIFAVYIKLQVNNGKSKLPGHSFFINAGGLFEIDPDLEFPESALKNLRNLSPLTMLISSLRGFIKQLSSNSPQGGYLLPSIDIFDLIEKKGKKKKRRVNTKIIK